MTDDKRKQTIDSWHLRADAYEILVNNYRIFTDMASGLVDFVEKNRIKTDQDLHIIDLAAGTGLVSKLLINNLHISPSSLYLIEPAEQMCVRARDNIKTPHIYQVAAEDCLTRDDLPRDYFDFILCNASMHLMSENDIYPVVSKLLKPKNGYFLYTIWYHSFDETANINQNHEFESYIDQVLRDFNYPEYFSKPKSRPSVERSRKYLEKTADENGLRVYSCTIYMHQVPMSFDLDFSLMSPDWLVDHLKTFAYTQSEDIHVMKQRIIEKVRDLIRDKYTEKAVVQIIVSRIS